MTEDRVRVRRVLPATVVESRVMLVGEAPGPSTQRLTGLPYIRPGGQMRTSGRTLEGLLNGFDYTVDPAGSRQYAYSTDLVRCVPLKPDQRGGRPPLPREIQNCSPFLDEEIALLRPRVVILMGRHSTQAFFRRYLGQTVGKLADVAGGPHDAVVSGVSLSAFAVPHPSPLVANKAARESLYRRVATDVAALLAAG